MSITPSPAISRPGRFHRFWRALHQLFLEVMGAVFAVVGLAVINLALRSWRQDAAHWAIAGAVFVALLFFYFSVTSFRRARKL